LFFLTYISHSSTDNQNKILVWKESPKLIVQIK
jgi:hypothetical protein